MSILRSDVSKQQKRRCGRSWKGKQTPYTHPTPSLKGTLSIPHSSFYFTAPFNNMRTLKCKDQPTNGFFATVNPMFGGSSQPPTTAERAVIKSSSTVQTTKQCSAVVGRWEEPPNIWLTVAKKEFVGWALSPHVTEKRSKNETIKISHRRLIHMCHYTRRVLGSVSKIAITLWQLETQFIFDFITELNTKCIFFRCLGKLQ